MPEQLSLIPEAAPSTENKIARRIRARAEQLGRADALGNRHRSQDSRIGTSGEAWAAYDAGWSQGRAERAEIELSRRDDPRETERAFRSGFHVGFSGREHCAQEWETRLGWIEWFRGWQQGKKAAGLPLRAEILARAERKPVASSGSEREQTRRQVGIQRL